MGTAQASDYLENQIIDHLFRTATFSKPAAIYVALFTVAPTDAGGGTEVTGGSYARIALAPLNANWLATQGGTSGASSGTGGQTSNASIITFAAPSADWGTIVAVGIFDAVSSGNLLIWDTLSASRTVLNGDPAPTFPVGALSVTVG